MKIIAESIKILEKEEVVDQANAPAQTLTEGAGEKFTVQLAPLYAKRGKRNVFGMHGTTAVAPSTKLARWSASPGIRVGLGIPIFKLPNVCNIFCNSDLQGAQQAPGNPHRIPALGTWSSMLPGLQKSLDQPISLESLPPHKSLTDLIAAELPKNRSWIRLSNLYEAQIGHTFQDTALPSRSP